MKTILILIVFLPITLCVIGFFLLVAKLIKNAKNDSWEGKVVDKIYREVEDDGKSSDYYTLVIETANKVDRKVAVSAEEYKKAEVGDQYRKVKGELNPKKI
jgi:biopolymer transport protein ExbB/TolQ